MSIQQDAATILSELARHGDFEYVENVAISDATALSPERVSTAISILEDNGYVQVLRTLSNAPYTFLSAVITPQGRLALERAEGQVNATSSGAPGNTVPSVRPMPQPVGSPFGFTAHDFEYILLEQQSKQFIVVFGYQWQSEYYNTETLIRSISDEFEQALAKTKAGRELRLKFEPLRAGYGEHLFNQIARSIIASDVAVFETSDANPNVMIEMGVALTWGTRVHPIRVESRPSPPSDISGQTWACYSDSGARWTDPNHFEALVQMVELASMRKLSRL